MEASLQTPTSSNDIPATANQPTLPTFLDHIHELRSRLFWISVVFIIASAAAYPFRDIIIRFLVAPLKGQELYYITPVGGFSFIIKICTYVGAVMTMPALVYHLYKYLQPAVGDIKIRVVMCYVFFSTLLALTGVAFAYCVSLPAALYFLTGLDLTDVTAMLTIDSYYSFITTYMIGAALLFQLPLVLLIINSIKPLRPSALMGYQRHVVLGAFIVAAMISPTPDMTNQALLALPVIIMYQVGIILVWLRNLTKRSNKKDRLKVDRSRTKKTSPIESVLINESNDPLSWIDELFGEDTPNVSRGEAKPKQPAVIKSAASPKPKPAHRGYAMDMAATSRRRRSVAAQRPLPRVDKYASARSANSPVVTAVVTTPAPQQRPARYIDGVSVSFPNVI